MSKRKVKRAWWQKPKNIRRVAMGLVSSVIALSAVYFFIAGAGAGEPRKVVLRPFTPAEAFTLPTTSGNDVTSANYFGQGNVLLYFSEGVGCAPCFDQIVDLEANWDRFEAMDLKMVSVMV